MSKVSSAHPLAVTSTVPKTNSELMLANRKQLISWIIEANNNLLPGTKPLTKSGTKEKMRTILAMHYQITPSAEESADSVPASGKSKNKNSLDLQILQKQRDYRLSLAEEMMNSTAASPFLLSPPGRENMGVQLPPPQAGFDYNAFNQEFQHVMV